MLFKPMAIYYCSYSNFHHDPNPNLFVFNSTSEYTEGLNIHYLTPTRRYAFFNMIRKLANVGAAKGMVFHYNGVMMYAIIKKYYPDFAKVSYRKYFSRYLTGTLINDALNAASPLMTLYLKTQSMINKASSNYMQMKAETDPSTMEVNKYLADTRVKEMQNYEDMQYTIKPLPGPAAKPPQQVTPEQEDKNKPKPAPNQPQPPGPPGGT